MLRRLNNENPRINCDTSVFVLFLVMVVLSQSHRTHRRPEFFKHKTNVPSSVPLSSFQNLNFWLWSLIHCQKFSVGVCQWTMENMESNLQTIKKVWYDASKHKYVVRKYCNLCRSRGCKFFAWSIEKFLNKLIVIIFIEFTRKSKCRNTKDHLMIKLMVTGLSLESQHKIVLELILFISIQIHFSREPVTTS